MAETRPSCRLHVIFATGSRKAIVFRRGPSKTTRLIAWDRTTDTFEPGQWLRRASVYAERSAISPDGQHLLIFIGRFKAPFHAYTVLSRAPFFTALALWPVDHTWGGGGTFLGAREIVLAHTDDETKLAPGFVRPKGFIVHPTTPETRARVEAHWKGHETWRTHDADGLRSFTKPGGDGAALVARPRKIAKYRTVLDYAVTHGRCEARLHGAQWADLDTNGDVLFACAGVLDRLPAAAIALATREATVAPHTNRLADFSEMRFEGIAAPYPGGQGPVCDEEEPLGFAPQLDRISRADRRQRSRARKAKHSRASFRQ